MNAPDSRQAALESRRKRGIQAIKAAQRQLGLDDAAYRDLIQGQTERRDAEGRLLAPGKRSAADLSLAEQSKVLDHMRRSGAAHPGKSGGRRRVTPAADRAALMRKVHKLLDELHAVTGERHSMLYADAICRRSGWADSVDFCAPQDLHRLVGALANTVRAKARKAGVTTAA